MATYRKGLQRIMDMNEKEMIEKLIDKYTDLQRIKNAKCPEKEVDYQLAITKAKLESCGIITSNLDMYE